MNRTALLIRLSPWLFTIGLFVVWEAAVHIFKIPVFFLPPPTAIAQAFVDYAGPLARNSWITLQTTLIGFALAVGFGLLLGLVVGWSRAIYAGLYPLMIGFNAIPKVALVPILVLWFGIYLKAKIIVVFLFAVFPVLINTYQGVRECDKNMLEVAHSFRSSEWQMWQDVLLPFAVPYIIAGIRLAIGRGLIGMIIAEFYTTISGLGFMITRYANVFEMDKVFVPVIVLMVLGVSLTTLLKWTGRKIAPWSAANR